MPLLHVKFERQKSEKLNLGIILPQTTIRYDFFSLFGIFRSFQRLHLKIEN